MPCANLAVTRVANGATREQGGAAILLAMITMFVCAALATTMIAQLGRSIDSASGQQDLAQARILARGAVDWSRNVLADDKIRTAVDHTGQPWAVRVPPTPVENGEVSGEVQCWSGRFNLNNIAPLGEPDAAAIAAFVRLLQAIDVSQVEAMRLVDTLTRRMSLPTTSSTGVQRGPLLDPRELAALPGFDDALLDSLQPLAAALPAPSKINLNTAPAEVLMAITVGLDRASARALVAERERIWYRNTADFTSRLPPNVSLADPSLVDIRSRHFLVTGRASYGVATVRLEVLLDRAEIWPDIIWQRLL